VDRHCPPASVRVLRQRFQSACVPSRGVCSCAWLASKPVWVRASGHGREAPASAEPPLHYRELLLNVPAIAAWPCLVCVSWSESGTVSARHRNIGTTPHAKSRDSRHMRRRPVRLMRIWGMRWGLVGAGCLEMANGVDIGFDRAGSGASASHLRVFGPSHPPSRKVSVSCGLRGHSDRC
jgi:hypothetical protein